MPSRSGGVPVLLLQADGIHELIRDHEEAEHLLDDVHLRLALRVEDGVGDAHNVLEPVVLPDAVAIHLNLANQGDSAQPVPLDGASSGAVGLPGAGEDVLPGPQLADF